MAPKRFQISQLARAEWLARGAIDGSRFSLYISTVHLTRGFRVKRASGRPRRAPAPVQYLLSISAWPRRHMAPASLRI